MDFERTELDQYLNFHKGATALCIGTGASVHFSNLDFANLEDVVTIGSNDIGNVFQPNYLIAIDDVSPKSKNYTTWCPENTRSVKFLWDRYKCEDDSTIYFPMEYDGKMRDRVKRAKQLLPDSELHSTNIKAMFSSTLATIQLAILMGCKRIAIVGADFSKVNGKDYFWDFEEGEEFKSIVDLPKFSGDAKSHIIDASSILSAKCNVLRATVKDFSFGYLNFPKCKFNDNKFNEDINKWLRNQK